MLRRKHNRKNSEEVSGSVSVDDSASMMGDDSVSADAEAAAAKESKVEQLLTTQNAFAAAAASEDTGWADEAEGRRALSSSIRHHAALLRDGDASLDGLDEDDDDVAHVGGRAAPPSSANASVGGGGTAGSVGFGLESVSGGGGASVAHDAELSAFAEDEAGEMGVDGAGGGGASVASDEESGRGELRREWSDHADRSLAGESTRTPAVSSRSVYDSYSQGGGGSQKGGLGHSSMTLLRSGGFGAGGGRSIAGGGSSRSVFSSYSAVPTGQSVADGGVSVGVGGGASVAPSLPETRSSRIMPPEDPDYVPDPNEYKSVSGGSPGGGAAASPPFPPPYDSYLPGSGQAHNTKKAHLARAVIALICVGASLTISLTIGQGAIGQSASSLYYKSAIASDVSDGGTPGYVPPDLESVDPPIALPYTMRNVANVTEPLPAHEGGTDLPLFWAMPKAGGSVVRAIMSQCLGLVTAGDPIVEAGGEGDGHSLLPMLQVVETKQGTRYVNVDTTTSEGIERAKNLNLAASGLASVAITPLLHQAAGKLSTAANMGRLFTILRHPVELAASHFFHEKRINAAIEDMSITEYAREGYLQNNFLTRSLANLPENQVLTDADLYVALEMLRRKVLVGLVDDISGSIARFERYFGWEAAIAKDCQDKLLEPSKKRNPAVEVHSEAWDLILAENLYDIQVYHYGKYLFGQQG